MSFTQRDIANSALLSIDTIRKIENGKVLPNQITLEVLSNVLKEDLNKTLLNYRICNNDKIFQVIKQIEKNIANGHFEDLIADNEILSQFLSDENHDSYTYKLVKQLSLLLESIIIKTVHNRFEDSLNKLIQAIILTTPSFTLNNYMNFYYSDFEIRILMNIALIENKLGNTETCQKILLFSLDHLDDKNTELRIKILYNLSYNFHRKNLHHKALHYANEAIQIGIKENNFTILGLLYSRKGIAEFNINDPNHIKSIQTAISLHNLLNQENLKKNLLVTCEKKGIQLS